VVGSGAWPAWMQRVSKASWFFSIIGRAPGNG
jgi:hypothetical protein